MNKRVRGAGFTIVELLVVIVVIAILAVITIVVFNGIQRRAVQSSLQADVDGAKKKLMLYQVDNGSYPTAINCTNPSSTEICLRPSGANTFMYTANNTTSPPQFMLSAKNGDITYQATQSTAAEPIQGPVTNGLVARLDAADSASYPGSGTVWSDLSGNGRSASLSNTTFTTDGGGAIAFDGATSLGRIASGSVQSVFMFVYVDSSKTEARYLLDSRTGNKKGYLFSGGVGNWTNFFVNTQPVSASWTSIPTNRWISFYAATATSYTATINIMSRYSNTETLPGRLGVILVYNRTLTQAEITQNFNAFAARYGLSG